MKCTELAKNGNKSVVEIRDDDNRIVRYAVCTDFNNAKAYGTKWVNGHYYDVCNTLGHYQEDMLRSAMLFLYGIKEYSVPYERVLEFARAFFQNMDIDSDMAEHLKNDEGITEEEAELFHIKEKLFQKKYKIVEVTFAREQEVTIKVVMPDDIPDSRAEDYVGDTDYLENEDIETTNDWYRCDYDRLEADMNEEEIQSYLMRNEVWNENDFPNNLD